MKRVNAYLLPAQIDPGEFSCFRVYVPKDTMYLGAFWAAYEYFTSWLAWAKDPLHKGKHAAAVWRVGFDRARAEYLQSKGVCEMNVTGIRQDPLNGCNLQVEFDGNNTWVTVADLGKCGGGAGGCGDCVLRFNGSTVQHYDPCSDTWEDNGPASSPAFDGAVASANVYEGTGARCDAAANIADYVDKINDQIEQGMVDVEGVLTSVLKAYILITAMQPETQWLAALAEGFNNADEYVGNIWADNLAFNPKPYMQVALLHHLESNGTLTSGGFSGVIAELQGAIDLDGTAAGLGSLSGCINIMRVLGPLGLTRANKSAGITGVDCSGIEWQEIISFALGKQGWLSAPGYVNMPLATEWQSGQGWNAVYVVNPGNGNGYMRVDIHRLLPATQLTYIRIEYDAHLGATGADPYYADMWSGLNGAGGSRIPSSYQAISADTVDGIFIWVGSQAVSDLYLSVQVGQDVGGGDPGGAARIKRVTLRGTGSNPF